MKKTKYLIPAAVIATGIFFGIYTYTHYTLFKPSQGPGDGFLPFILSVLLVIVGLFDLRKCGERKTGTITKENWLIVLCVGAVIALSYLIGMVPCILIFAFLWLKLKEKCTWKETIISMVVIVILVVGIFAVWMEIPFPEGLLYEMIVG